MYLLVVAGAEARKPSVDEIFDFLLTDLETKDLLYVCDFFKTYQYVCNVTQLGVPSLKNHQSPPKKGAEKLQKVVLTNVSGHWSDSDGEFFLDVSRALPLLHCNSIVRFYEELICKGGLLGYCGQVFLQNNVLRVFRCPEMRRRFLDVSM